MILSADSVKQALRWLGKPDDWLFLRLVVRYDLSCPQKARKTGAERSKFPTKITL